MRTRSLVGPLVTLAVVASSAFAQNTTRTNSSRSDSTRPAKATKPKTTSHPKRTTAPAAPAISADSLRRLREIKDSVEYARRWPVKSAPTPLPGAILPAKRIIAYYGNPLSKKMGILGELEPEQMLARLDKEVAAWSKADPSTPVQPALHLIAVVAQGGPGRDSLYRLRMDSSLIEKVYGWAKSKNAILFLDIQVGKSSLQSELPRLTPFLKRPDVHLAIDPEFSMHYGSQGAKPGTKIGTFDAVDVNYASSFLADLVTKEKLPPKVLIVHRFTRNMLRNSAQIRLDNRVQVVINMDGWGAPWLKRDSYHVYVYEEPVVYTGVKLFYHNDTKKGNPLMWPNDVLALRPKPIYIQYQ
jgi:hypothetical protein